MRGEADEVDQFVGVGLKIVEVLFDVGVAVGVVAGVGIGGGYGVFPSVGTKGSADLRFADLHEQVIRPIGVVTAEQGYGAAAVHSLGYGDTGQRRLDRGFLAAHHRWPIVALGSAKTPYLAVGVIDKLFSLSLLCQSIILPP